MTGGVVIHHFLNSGLVSGFFDQVTDILWSEFLDFSGVEYVLGRLGGFERFAVFSIHVSERRTESREFR